MPWVISKTKPNNHNKKQVSTWGLQRGRWWSAVLFLFLSLKVNRQSFQQGCVPLFSHE
jgi:hypothetical protein